MPAMPQWMLKFPLRWTVRSTVLGFGLTLATAAVYLSWAAQPVRRVKIADVAGTQVDRVFVNSQPASVGAEATTGQQVLTLQNAKVGFQQMDTLLARLGAQSAATIENDCIQLGDGQVVLSGTQGCIGAAIVSSKDAIYVLQRQGTLGEIKVLAGQIDVAVPSNPSIQSISLTPNQKVTLSLIGDEIGPIRLMLPAEVEGILAGELFQGFKLPLVGQTTIAGLRQPAIVPPTPQKPTTLAQPTVPAPAVPISTAAHPSDHPSSISETADYESSDARSLSYSNDERDQPKTAYTRYARRRYTPSDSDSYTYRRRWARSPYSGSSYRRRPSYSPPDYSPPASTPAPQPPPAVEVPPPVELPPAVPLPAPELPPSAIAEPPLEKPPI